MTGPDRRADADTDRRAAPDTDRRGDAARHDVEVVGEESVEHNPDPQSARETFEREIAERGESDEGTDVGTLVDPDEAEPQARLDR
jgi:hypothetical protein